MRKIMYTRPDGGLSVVHPVINSYPAREDITEEEAEQRAWGKLPKDAVNPRFVDASAIPQDRSFRNAWMQTADVVGVDMAKAAEIHRNYLRELRGPRLAALDVEYQRADENGDAAAKASIAARKQALRDVTNDPAITAARTPEDLKACIPEVLK